MFFLEVAFALNNFDCERDDVQKLICVNVDKTLYRITTACWSDSIGQEA